MLHNRTDTVNLGQIYSFKSRLKLEIQASIWKISAIFSRKILVILAVLIEIFFILKYFDISVRVSTYSSLVLARFSSVLLEIIFWKTKIKWKLCKEHQNRDGGVFFLIWRISKIRQKLRWKLHREKLQDQRKKNCRQNSDKNCQKEIWGRLLMGLWGHCC